MNIPGFKKSKLDRVEEGLNDPKKVVSDTVVVHDAHTRRVGALPTTWGEDSPMLVSGAPVEDHSASFGLKLLGFSLVFLLVVAGYSAWRILSSQNVVSSENIEIVSDLKSYIEGGEQVPMVVTILNKNAVTLEEARITVSYERGVGSSDEQQKIYEKQELGTIEPNQMQKKTFTLVFYGEEGSARDVSVKLEYKVPGSNAVFSKVETKTSVLKTPPIGVYIDGPELLSQGQIGTYTVTARNNTSTSSVPFRLAFISPEGFTKDMTNPPVSGKDIAWNIDSLNPGESREFIVKGYFSGVSGEVNTIRVLVGSAKSGSDISTVYSSDKKEVSIRTSPLTVSFAMQTSRGLGESLRFGDRASVEIVYENKSNEIIRNIELRATLEGDAVVYEDIAPEGGYYDSEQKLVLWNKATLPSLESLAPGSTGAVRIQIPIVTKGKGSPTFTIHLQGTADNKEIGDVSIDASKLYTVQGSASLITWTSYRESPFANTGPIPPEPNIATTYTIHLVASAQNSLSGTKVSFNLPIYVSWANVFTENMKITYNASTRTVVWDIGALASDSTFSADVQVSVKPSQSHVNTSPPITSGITLEGQEVETRSKIKTTIPAATTALTREEWGGNPSAVISR